MEIVTERELLEGQAAEREAGAWGRKRQLTEAQNADLLECAQLVGKAFGGNRYAMLQVGEALATSDFRFLFGALMDAELLERYQDAPATWTAVAKRTTLATFKPKSFVDLLGGRSILSPVPQGTPYLERDVTESKHKIQVGKLGARIGLYWEMIVNDELDAFRELPDDLAIGARDTEQFTVTSLLASKTGPNARFFNADNGNLLAGNPALTTDSLTAALGVIKNKRDEQGRPIVVRAVSLVVPPSLQPQAERILNATEIRQFDEATGQTVVTTNTLKGKVTIVEDPWLPVVDQSANADSTWYLTPDPQQARPAFALGFLRGHEDPDLRVRSQTGSRVGGGAIGAEEGDFDDDSIHYRVRHVLGGGAVDVTATAVSTGAGS